MSIVRSLSMAVSRLGAATSGKIRFYESAVARVKMTSPLSEREESRVRRSRIWAKKPYKGLIDAPDMAMLNGQRFASQPLLSSN